MSSVTPAQKLRAGALFAGLAALCFALMGSLIKLASAELGNVMIVFLRNLLGLLILLPWLVRAGRRNLRTRRLGLHLVRTATGLTAMYCFFFALANMPLADAMLISYSTPLFIPLIAWAWLGERPPLALLPVVLVGLAGVTLVLRPEGGQLISLAGLAAACTALFAGAAFVTIRRLSSTEPSLRIVFHFTVFGLVVSAIPAAIWWQSPSPRALLLMLGVGTFATAGQYLLTRAYSHAPAAQIAPFNYLVVFWAALVGWLWWAEIPDRWTVIGSLLVIASSFAALRIRPAPG